VPLLQAEEDRRYLRLKAQRDADEAKIMKDVAGWEVGKSTFKTGWV
jgi:hypothetical protein